jgi:hypothetical protein
MLSAYQSPKSAVPSINIYAYGGIEAISGAFATARFGFVLDHNACHGQKAPNIRKDEIAGRSAAEISNRDAVLPDKTSSEQKCGAEMPRRRPDQVGPAAVVDKA